jgi:outer membrane protein assembly factor BamB
MARFHVLLAFCLPLIAANVTRAADWPGFRGPLGIGVTEESDFPTTWSAKENVVWKFLLPNKGNESPIVSNGRVFVTSANADGTKRSLHCVDRKTGKELWTKTVPFENVEKTHGTNPFGAATPAADGERVVVWHGSAGLFCYDFAGKQLWSTPLGVVTHVWGYGSSPVIHKGRVFVNYGPGKEQGLVAVDLKDGKEVWRLKEGGGLDDRKGTMTGSWSTPVITQVDGHDQLICSLPTRLVSVDPANGELISWCDGLKGRNGNLVYTSPVIGNGICVAMGGYTGPAMAVQLGGTGDVTESNRLWHNDKKNPQRIGSGVVIDEHLYMANAGPGTIQCIKLTTGEEAWATRGPGGNHWGALVSAGGHLYVTAQTGATAVFKPNAKEYTQVAVNKLGDSSNSTPAFSDGEIFIRTSKTLYCIGK